MKRAVLMTASVLALLLAACGPGGQSDADGPDVVTEPVVELFRAPVVPSQAGDSYYVAAAEAVKARANGAVPKPRAKNVIIFIGDGMGISTITAGRIYSGQINGADGESHRLAMETMPYTALSKVYAHDAQVPDSAATATAMLSGVKTRARTVGLMQGVAMNNCATVAGNETQSLFAIAEEAGMATGVISTARLTHATPAASYAHSPMRDWESAAQGGCPDIATQFVEWQAGDGFEIALAGGRREFLPADQTDPEYDNLTGRRGDGTNLVEAWLGRGNNRVFISDAAGFGDVDFNSDVRVLGLFEPSHMQYELDRPEDGAGEPSLAELTEAAITRLSRDEDGFVLLVEGGRIDHAHHGSNAARALGDTVAFDAAIATALEMTSADDTLIIVTADHSHTMVIQGYQGRNTPILGLAAYQAGTTLKAADGKPYTTLAYTNGPGAACAGLADPSEACTREDLSEIDTAARDYRQQSLIPMPSETHAGEDVAIFASGPGAELVRGVMEQNEIFHVMGYASGLVSAD